MKKNKREVWVLEKKTEGECEVIEGGVWKFEKIAKKELKEWTRIFGDEFLLTKYVPEVKP